MHHINVGDSEREFQWAAENLKSFHKILIKENWDKNLGEDGTVVLKLEWISNMVQRV